MRLKNIFETRRMMSDACSVYICREVRTAAEETKKEEKKENAIEYRVPSTEGGGW